MISKEKLYFKVTNNTNAAQQVNLFDVNQPFGSAGQGTTYEWDMTQEFISALLYGSSYLILVSAPVSSNIYTSNVYSNSGTTITSIATVIAALNGFGVGVFTNVGNIVSVTSTTRIFSTLTIGNIFTTAHPLSVGAPNGVGGSLLFSAYNEKLIGTFARISLANPFWVSAGVGFTGPYNRAYIYSAGNGLPQAMFTNINVASARTVYVGLSWYTNVLPNPYFIEFYVNMVRKINVATIGDLTALQSQNNGQLGTSYTLYEQPYVFWYIFPVQLNAGENIIQAFLTPGVGCSPDMGFEVYDNTAAEIAAATGYGGLNLLYSSVDYVGQDFF